MRLHFLVSEQKLVGGLCESKECWQSALGSSAVGNSYELRKAREPCLFSCSQRTLESPVVCPCLCPAVCSLPLWKKDAILLQQNITHHHILFNNGNILLLSVIIPEI